MVMRLALGQNPFLTADIIDRCKNAGILTIVDFLSIDPETLCQQISISYKDAASIRRVFLGTYSSFIQSGENLYEELLQCFSILGTGCPQLDEFLNGGLYTGEITAVHGSSGAGKTQLCINIVANLLLESENTFIYLDSTCGLTIGRLKQIMLSKTEDVQLIMEKLKLLRVFYVHDVYGLFDILHSIKDSLLKQDDSFYSRLKLLVLDSLTPIFAPCYIDNERRASGLLVLAAQLLKFLCKEHALAVLVTSVCNVMAAQPGASSKHALERHWSYAPSVTLHLKKDNAETINKERRISLAKSCRQGIGDEMTIVIADKGIQHKRVIDPDSV